jgi:hypothetical protein
MMADNQSDEEFGRQQHNSGGGNIVHGYLALSGLEGVWGGGCYNNCVRPGAVPWRPLVPPDGICLYKPRPVQICKVRPAEV